MAPRKQSWSKTESSNNSSKRPAIQEKAIPKREWRHYQNATEKQQIKLPGHAELIWLVVFLLLSIIVLSGLNQHPAPNAELSAVLGMSPPLLWINVAFFGYVLSEFILILCRTRKTDSSRYALRQLLNMTGFYLFYWYAGVLPEHFSFLLIVGILLQSLEAFARKNPLGKIIIEDE
jgi:hypothetical protein